jgi:hypothetical protein
MGDVSAETSQSTYCHACSARLIGRAWYDIARVEPDRRRSLRGV